MADETPRWRVEIVGDDWDLEGLRLALPDGDVTVRADDDGRHFLRSSHFAGLDTASDVYSGAKAELVRITGAMAVAGDAMESLRLGRVVERGPDGSDRVTQVVEVDTIRGRTRMGRLTVVGIGGEPAAPVESPVAVWVRLSHTDPTIATVLRILSSSDLDWYDLYKLYELVKKATGKIPRDWMSRRQCRRFTQSANHPEATGDEARHAVLSSDPPADPMSLPDATELIRRLVETWLMDTYRNEIESHG